MATHTDTTLLATIIIVFVAIGSFLPYIKEEFNETPVNVSVDDLRADVGEVAESESVLSGFNIFVSVVKMFFWTFGDLPIFLDLIFLVFRIILVWLVVRIIRGV